VGEARGKAWVGKGTIMRNFRKMVQCSNGVFGACLIAFGLVGPSSVSAQTIIDDWEKVKPPAAPELKPVTVDVKDTALLILDFNGAQDPSKGPCNKNTRSRCIASIPKVQKLLAEARAKGVFVVYSLGGAGGVADIATDLTPNAGDPVVKSGPDKFVGTDLEKILASKAIKTVIVTGTGAEGAVLNTASDAALKGMNVVVPVDGMSSFELYAEQYVAWHLTHAPGVSPKVTLTRIDMIKF
jgi:nicotinamidase-related amidase